MILSIVVLESTFEHTRSFDAQALVAAATAHTKAQATALEHTRPQRTDSNDTPQPNQSTPP